MTATADEFHAWFRPAEGSESPQMAGFRLGATTLEIKEYQYAMASRASSAGVPLIDTRPAESNETYSHQDATVRLLRSHAEAEIRVITYEPGAAAQFAMDDTYRLFANRTQAAGWEDSASVQYRDGTHPEIVPFFVAPEEHLILTGNAGTLMANGTLGLWLHGFDIQVTQPDGSTTTYAGHPDSQGANQGPLHAEAESWRDYLFEVDGHVHLQIDWDGPSDLFAPTLHVTGDGRMLAAKVHGAMPGADGAETEYRGTDIVVEGPIDVTAYHDAAESGDRIGLNVRPAAASAPMPAPTSGTFGGLGWLALSGILVAFVGTGVAVPVALRTWQRRSPAMPPQPNETSRPDEDPAAAVGNRISSLLDEGEGKQAVALLQKEVRKRPKSPELRYALGVAFGQAGTVGRALVHLDYALRQDHSFLGMLVSDPRTEAFRHDPAVARMVRRAARRFHDEAHRGYA